MKLLPLTVLTGALWRRPGRRASRPRPARAAVLSFLIAVAVLNFGLAAAMEFGDPWMRDQEFGVKLRALRARAAERPGRPLVVVLGSSRVAMGVRPEVLEPELAARAARGERAPVVFNASLVGSGPVMELMCLQRLVAAGVRPDALLVEYWPPFLRQDGGALEEKRLWPTRLNLADVALLSRYSPDPAALQRNWRAVRLAPWYEHRYEILDAVKPGWLAWNVRRDGAWSGLDGWGWLRSSDSDAAGRPRRVESAGNFYRVLLQDYQITPCADRALRDLLGFCREQAIPVSLVVLPESSEFRAWYPPAVRELADRHLNTIRDEFGVTVHDGRDWLPDDSTLDGFHLTPAGAEAFTLRLGREALSD